MLSQCFSTCPPQPTVSALLLHTLPNDLLRQLRKVLAALLFYHLPQIGLCEHRKRVPRHILASAVGFAAAHKVRHSAQSAPSDQLQRQTGLEGQAVTWDVYLRRAAGAVADPEAGFGVRVGFQLGEGRGLGARGERGRMGVLIDEHLAREAGQGAKVGVGGAPVVVVFLGGGGVRCCWCGGGRGWKVMQQSRFRAHARPHDVLQRAGLVALELRHAVAVAAARYEARDVDDQLAKGLELGFEAREDCFAGPDIGGDHFDDGGVQFAGFGFQGFTMDGVGIVGALEGVVAAIGERFFAAGPADVVFCCGIFEFGLFLLPSAKDQM